MPRRDLKVDSEELNLKTIGKIFPKESLFLRLDCGKASNPETGDFELSMNVGGNLPLVRSKKTGKWFSLGWQDIINLAIHRGILDEDKPET